MQPKYRYLPSLNDYFYQKRSFEQHRKKIDEIKRSIQRSRLKIKTENSEVIQGNNKPQLSFKFSIQKNAEQSSNHNKRRLSPRSKRDQYNIRLQNHRLLSRIEKRQESTNIVAQQQTENKQKIMKYRINQQNNVYLDLSSLLFLTKLSLSVESPQRCCNASSLKSRKLQNLKMIRYHHVYDVLQANNPESNHVDFQGWIAQFLKNLALINSISSKVIGRKKRAINTNCNVLSLELQNLQMKYFGINLKEKQIPKL